MNHPIKNLTIKERVLWLLSVVLVSGSNLVSGSVDLLTMAAAVIGVTAVLFCAKGNVWGQILIAVFSLMYGAISWRFHYWGEMITYMGMAFPMALWSIYTWVTHPSLENASEVKIHRLTHTERAELAAATVLVTVVFYEILKYFHTPNLLFSTISITTSFVAAALTMLRSSYYAVWYAMNDMILIILWSLASLTDRGYVPVVVNFIVFLVNDSYGFLSWKRRENRQIKDK